MAMMEEICGNPKSMQTQFSNTLQLLSLQLKGSSLQNLVQSPSSVFTNHSQEHCLHLQVL